MDIAFLIARLFLGLGMAAHGAQKLLGWFEGRGLTVTGEFFVRLGWRPGRAFATAAAVGEVASGLLVALGFLGPIGPALMLNVMLVAAVTVHLRNGFFTTKNGIELPAVYAASALLLAFAGPGAYSVDRLIGFPGLTTPRIAWLAIAVAVVLAGASILARRTSEPASAPSR